MEEIVFEGKVRYMQVLDKDGNADVGMDPDLPKDELIKMYLGMLVARAFDEKAMKLQRSGRMLTFAPLRGQEASQIGSVHALEKTDWFFPTYRENGSLMYRGVPASLLFRYWMGSEWGAHLPKDQKNYNIIIDLGTQTLHAAGTMWAAKIKKDPCAGMVCIGDGATSEGAFHEAMNFAGVFKPGLVFFCQNNQYAISIPRKKQTASKTIAQKALAYGFEGIQVDGNDILAVYSACEYALKKARNGEGPTLIEAVTYRMGPHTTADDPTRYRTNDEVKYWEDRDPLKRFKMYLLRRGYLPEGFEAKVAKTIDEQLEKAISEAENSKDDPLDMFNFVYAKPTQLLFEEMKEFNEYLSASKGITR